MPAVFTSTAPNQLRVLFVAQDDSSPQIAASVLRRLAGDRVEVRTAGTQVADPGGRSDEMLVAMGLNPADQRRLSAAALRSADRVIALGAGLDVARLPGPRYEEWDLAQDDLVARVEALSAELTAVPDEPVRWPVLDRMRTPLGAAVARLRRLARR